MIALIIISYIVLACALVYLSILLSNYVDMLDKTTKLSGALLGGVLLAAVTSLPELFTTITAVVGVGEYGYVIGNIMGSNVFDIAILVLLFVIFIKNTTKERIAKSNLFQLFFLICMTGVIAFSIFMPESIKKYFYLGGWFNWLTILIVGFYVASLFIIDKTEEKSEIDEVIKLTKKQILIRFSIASVLLIATSIGVTFLSDMIVEEFKIDPTAAGATLLGIMTSLPEIISTFNLFYKKNVNAGTGNMIGSAVFNMMIIAIAEVISFNGSIYVPSGEVNKLVILGSICFVSCLIALVFKFLYSSKSKDNKSLKIVFTSGIVLFSLISFASYILYFTLD